MSRTAFVTRVLEAVDQICPFRLAQPSDNIGLLYESLNEPDESRANVLIAYRLTEEVIDEAHSSLA